MDSIPVSQEKDFAEKKRIFGRCKKSGAASTPVHLSTRLALDKSMINADVIQEGAQARAFLSAYPPFRR